MRWTRGCQIIHTETSRPFAEVDRNRPPRRLRWQHGLRHASVCEMMVSSPMQRAGLSFGFPRGARATLPPIQPVKITAVKFTVRRSALLLDMMGRLVPQMRCRRAAPQRHQQHLVDRAASLRAEAQAPGQRRRQRASVVRGIPCRHATETTGVGAAARPSQHPSQPAAPYPTVIIGPFTAWTAKGSRKQQA
jgi:hypothetical protein